MENKIIYDSSIDQGLIKSMKVAVIGFGSQGHAHSLNLHESGVDITVGLREDSESFKRAQDMGLQVANLEDATKNADVVMLLLPDQIMADVYNDQIASHIKEGATLAAGGPDLPNGLNKGYFVKPTIFTDVNNDMKIAREEIFGPVLSIIPFDTEEEAIKITNDTSYGLGNYLQTEDKEKAKRVARKVRAGTVYINGQGAETGAPFGGFKQSGNGREGGLWGFTEYLEVKAITGWN